MLFRTLITLGLPLLGARPVRAADDRPNIVFVLTDDQDVHMSGLEHMPPTQKYLVDKGTSFDRHYCTGIYISEYTYWYLILMLMMSIHTVSICCPSRVNIWTGQLSHNTNVTSVRPPYGTPRPISISNINIPLTI